MRILRVKMHDVDAGILIEDENKHYSFIYESKYIGPPISLTMPLREQPYNFETFPAFFDGLLPEGVMLEGLLKTHKIDRTDYMQQLTVTGHDLVGAVTVEKFPDTHE
jgi:serine/threonine-protein kinase HipA